LSDFWAGFVPEIGQIAREEIPTSIGVTAKSGQVYIFTATWSSNRLVLQPSNYYSPTTRVGEVRSMPQESENWLGSVSAGAHGKIFHQSNLQRTERRFVAMAD